MINVCNIFNPCNKENGNFLLFSQYTDDLSRSTVDSNYNVRPSRFVCLDLDINIYDNADEETKYETMSVFDDATQAVPGYFQNTFENGISVLRSEKNVSPYVFSIAFLERLMVLTKKSDGAIDAYESEIGGGPIIFNSIVYEDKIDLESWNDGFADIFLTINSGSSKKNAEIMPQNASNWIVNGGISTFQNNCGKETYSTKGYISGWNSSDNLELDGYVDNQKTIGTGEGGSIFNPDSVSVESSLTQLFKFVDDNDNSENSFTFNTIVLFYDILDENGNPLYSDIPMGIYFTGEIKIDGVIDNPVTIYKSNSSTYGAGSGWSLRIATRFSPMPNGLLKVEEVAVESNAITESLSALMAANAETLKSIQDFITNSNNNTQQLETFYSEFKDYRTNVPYTKEIGDKTYWFVNGRNTGAEFITNGKKGWIDMSISGVIPTYFIDLIEAAGGKFNEKSGYFEIGEVKDLTYEEMKYIYSIRTTNSHKFYDYQGINSRTILPLIGGHCEYSFTSMDKIIYIPKLFCNSFTSYVGTYPYLTKMLYSFNTCPKLEKIDATIYGTGDASFGTWGTQETQNENTFIPHTFKNCPKLEYVNIINLNTSVSFVDSPITVDCIADILYNSSNTQEIYIFVSAGTYDECVDDLTAEHSKIKSAISERSNSNNIYITTDNENKEGMDPGHKYIEINQNNATEETK